jgi:hypothetical protein
VTDFGRDTSCTTSLKTGRLVSGVRLVAESYFRRVTTPRGMLRGEDAERNFGLDLSELVGRAATQAEIASIPGQVESELMKDERSESIAVTVADVSDDVVAKKLRGRHRRPNERRSVRDEARCLGAHDRAPRD